MTKRECVDYIKDRINQTDVVFLCDWEKTGKPHTEIKHKNYLFCKKICSKIGYDDKTFEVLWNEAADELYRESLEIKQQLD